MEAEIGEIAIFTKILDGKDFFQCECGFICRALPGSLSTERCPDCHRRLINAKPSTEVDYRAQRK